MKYLFFIFLIFIASCSHESKRKTVTISTTSLGTFTNEAISLPMLITNEIKTSLTEEKILKIHQGHFLGAKLSKEENIQILKDLENANFHLVNLSLSDIAIAEHQEIDLTQFKKLIFLNSTVTDINRGDLYSNINILPYYIFEDAVFIGLSDHVIDSSIPTNRFLFNDHVFSILKVKKVTSDRQFKSYIIIHHINDEINTIMDRLPPSFINSLAN
jgi:hypothetical protein